MNTSCQCEDNFLNVLDWCYPPILVHLNLYGTIQYQINKNRKKHIYIFKTALSLSLPTSNMREARTKRVTLAQTSPRLTRSVPDVEEPGQSGGLLEQEQDIRGQEMRTGN